MYKSALLLITFCFCLFPLCAQETTPFSIGESFEIESKLLSETRTVNVYLPHGFSRDSATTYNTLYVLDGSAHEDFLHIVGLVQFFDLQLHLPPTIVVGISNVDRKRDFTFHTDNTEFQEYCPTCGKSAPFIQFIKQELQPTIDKQYPVNGHKLLIGQSLGGLLASEILLKEPDLFNDYLIVSPSLWWDDESLLEAAPAMIEAQADVPRRVYISVGTEGKIMEKDAKGLHKVYMKAGKENLTLYFNHLKKEDHATILHNSVYAGLSLLYPFSSETEK